MLAILLEFNNLSERMQETAADVKNRVANFLSMETGPNSACTAYDDCVVSSNSTAHYSFGTKYECDVRKVMEGSRARNGSKSVSRRLSR